MLEGEVGYVTDDPNQYKIGDGVHTWNELPLRGFDGTLVHTKSTDSNSAMAAKENTEYLNLTGAPQIFMYEDNADNLSINFSTRKVTYVKSGRPIAVYNNPNYGSIYFNAIKDHETDFVLPEGGSIANNQAWVLVFDYQESKFYLRHYTAEHINERSDDGKIRYVFIGVMCVQTTGRIMYSGNMPLTINGKHFYPVQEEITDVALKKNLNYNYAFINSVTRGSFINIDTFNETISVNEDFVVNLNGTNKSYTWIYKSDNQDIPITYITKGGVGNVAIIYNISTNKIEAYKLYQDTELPSDRNTYYIIGVAYCNFNTPNSITWLTTPITGPNDMFIRINGIGKFDCIGLYSGLRIISNTICKKVDEYTLRLPSSFILYDDFGTRVDVSFSDNANPNNNTYSSRSYPTEMRDVNLKDFLGDDFTQNIAANIYFDLGFSSNTDFSELPIRCLRYSGYMSDMIPNTLNGKTALMSTYRFGNFFDPSGYILFEEMNKTFTRVLGYSFYMLGTDIIADCPLQVDTVNKKVRFMKNDRNQRIWLYPVVSSTSFYLDTNNSEIAYETDFIETENAVYTQLYYIVYLNVANENYSKGFYCIHYTSTSQFLKDCNYSNCYLIGEGTLNKFPDNFISFGPIVIDGKLYSPNNLSFRDERNYPFLDVIRTENLFNKETVYRGYAADGLNFTLSESFYTSDYIAVTAGKKYKWVADENVWVYAYDADKNPVKVVPDDTPEIVGQGYAWNGSQWRSLESIPEGISYVRAILRPQNLDTKMFTENSVNTSTYIPYYDIKIKPEYLTDVEANEDVIPSYGKSEVGNLQYSEIGSADYAQIILYGQSLSMGWECPEVITTEAIEGNYMVGNNPLINHGNNHDETLHPLVAVKWSSGGEQPIVAATNSFSKLYRRFMNKSQLFIGSSAGEGGQSIERLSKECTNCSGNAVENNYYHTEFLRLLDQTKAAVDKESKTVNCFAILYMQGEHNYTGSGLGMTAGTEATKDKDTYKNYLMTLKNNMQADIMSKYGQTEKPLFFIYEVCGGYINNKEMTINMAQIEFAQENDDVFLLNSTYGVPDYNGGHLSTNGYRWYGELMAKSLYDTFVRGVKFETPIFPKQFTVSGNQLLIDFFVPVLPLVFDTWTKETIANMGFRLYNNNAEVSISKLEIKNNRVIITAASDLKGTVEITYAGQGRSGSGNLRDSDEYHSLYTYFDDRETAPTKRENYTPKDESGNYIYGKPYPMYNWCANFYYKIEQ